MTDTSSGDTIIGNVYDKYGTRNPIARWLMNGFLSAVTDLYRQAAPSSVLEVGTGEGRLAQHLVTHGLRPKRFEACDLDLGKMIDDLDPLIQVRQASIYELPWVDASFDLVVCCEVLEHVEDPRRALAELERVSARHVLVSTPREPLWRAMNLARGKYVRDLGNTPGHVQHFSRRALERLVGDRFDVLARRSPLPWTVLLAARRRS